MIVKSKKAPRAKAELLEENKRLLARLKVADKDVAAHEREATIEFLRVVNESATLQDLIDRAVSFFRQQTGCEAVGIRLQAGEDFPYFLSEGFRQGFLLTENTLCARDRTGEIIRDDQGHSVLECMCGKVISGQYDPANPYFTANGSFWTNSTTKLLAQNPMAERRQPRVRHRCHGEGYESVALIPLQAGEKRLGLIQLNDRRPGMFSGKNIDLWERLFGSLAVAIVKFQAEETLRESEERLRLALTAARMATWDWEVRSGAVVWNDMHYRMLGYEPGEVQPSYQAWLCRVHPEDVDTVELKIRDSMRQRRVYTTKFRSLWPDGTLHWLEARGDFSYDAKGQPLRCYGVMIDITEHHQSEELLRQKSRELEAARLKAENDKRLLWSMMSALPVGVAITNAEGGTILANDVFERIWAGPRPETQSVDDYVHYRAWRSDTGELVASDEWASALAVRTGEAVSGQLFKIQRFDGSQAFVLNSASPVRDAEGVIVGCAVAIQDVTELKAAEDKLIASLHEKEVLLKEIHHRVKNNLQVISSLVDLQADALDNPALSGLFQDVRDRVRSMAMVHETLYRSDNLVSVDFVEYASSLLNYLWRAHANTAGMIKLSLDLQPVTLAVETAVPCGLLLNELAVNALTHAFVGQDQGEVVVSMHADPEGLVRLSVSDNGVGFSEVQDWRQQRSLGLKLVQMLTKQLKGTVEAESNGGTEFRIAFANSLQAKGLGNC